MAAKRPKGRLLCKSSPTSEHQCLWMGTEFVCKHCGETLAVRPNKE